MRDTKASKMGHRFVSESSRKQLAAVSNSLAGPAAAISKKLHRYIDSLTIQFDGVSTTERMKTRGIAVRIALQLVPKSNGRPDDGDGDGGSSMRDRYCQTVTEICGEGLDDYIYCTYEVCVDAISGA